MGQRVPLHLGRYADEEDAARAVASEAGERVGKQYRPEDVEGLAANASLEIAIDEYTGRLSRAEEACDRAGEERHSWGGREGRIGSGVLSEK